MDDGRVAFLDFGMTKRLDIEQIRLEEEVVKARLDGDAERLRQKLHELGLPAQPEARRRRAADAPRRCGRRLVLAGH